MAAIIVRKLRSMRRLSLFSILWFPIVWLGLGLARASILVITFKRLSPILGRKSLTLDMQVFPNDAQIRRAVQIRKVIEMGARNSPWVANCFPQAIVGRVLLGLYRIPYCLFFGMRRDKETADLLAHAWIMAGPEYVTGRCGGETYTAVGCYTNQRVKERSDAGH